MKVQLIILFNLFLVMNSLCYHHSPKITDECFKAPSKLEIEQLSVNVSMKYTFYAEILVVRRDREYRMYELFRCFGTFIYKNLIVTEAACMYRHAKRLPPVNDTFVELGLRRDRKTRDSRTANNTYPIDIIWCHPDFNVASHPRSPNHIKTLMSDICLVRLQGEIEYSDRIRPAHLPDPNDRSIPYRRMFRPMSSRDEKTKTFTLLKDREYRELSEKRCIKELESIERQGIRLPKNKSSLVCAVKTTGKNYFICLRRTFEFKYRFGHLYTRRNNSIVLLGFAYREVRFKCRSGDIFFRISSVLSWILASSKMLSSSCLSFPQYLDTAVKVKR